jgi:hypothetical protein
MCQTLDRQSHADPMRIARTIATTSRPNRTNPSAARHERITAPLKICTCQFFNVTQKDQLILELRSRSIEHVFCQLNAPSGLRIVVSALVGQLLNGLH